MSAMHQEVETAALISNQYYDTNLIISTPASVSPMMSPAQLTPRSSHTQQDLCTVPETDVLNPADVEVIDWFNNSNGCDSLVGSVINS